MEVRSLRKTKTWWNKDTVVKSIRALHAADIALNSERIKSDKNPKTSQIITNVIGKRTSGYGLLSAAYKGTALLFAYINAVLNQK